MYTYYFYEGKKLINKISNLNFINDKFSFLDGEVHTLIAINNNNIKISREQNEYKFMLILKDKPFSEYYLKKEDLTFNIEVEYFDVKYLSDSIKIRYKLETNEDEILLFLKKQ